MRGEHQAAGKREKLFLNYIMMRTWWSPDDCVWRDARRKLQAFKNMDSTSRDGAFAKKVGAGDTALEW